MLDAVSVRAILKHVHYKDPRHCIRVQKTARVRLPDGRRVYATRLYWEFAFGLVARKIDAHMQRSCTAQPGTVCMNPDHIMHLQTGEPLRAILARLAVAAPKKTPATTEEMLWVNRADAVEELVVDEEDLPHSMEDNLPPRMMDYFSLIPDVHLRERPLRGAITG